MTERDWAKVKRREASRTRLVERLRALVVTALEPTGPVVRDPSVAPAKWHLMVHHYGAFVQINLQLLTEGVQLLPVSGRVPLVNSVLGPVDTAVREAAAQMHLTVEEGAGATGPIVAGAEQYPVGRIWKLNLPNPA